MIIRSSDFLSLKSFFFEKNNLPIYCDGCAQFIVQISRSVMPLNRSISCSLNEGTIAADINKHNFLMRITKELADNYDKEDLKMGDLASNLAISQRQMYRIFKEVLNITPAIFLRFYRLEKSFWLIMQGELVGNIAYNVGFSSHSYFSHCFKEKFGKTPSECVNNFNERNRRDINSQWHKTIN